MFAGDLSDADHGRAAASVIHQAIQPPESAHSMIDHCLNAGLIGDVGSNEAQPRAASCLQRPAFGLAPSRGDDARTLGDERLGDPFANTAGGPGAYGYLAVQLAHAQSPSRSRQFMKIETHLLG